jgi:nucleoid-associated protein YgaU
MTMIRYDGHSGNAWESFRKRGGALSINGVIVRAAFAYPDGVTCRQVVDRYRLKHQTVSAQIRHLRDAGWLVVVGQDVEDGQHVNRYGRPSGAPQRELF